jgi:hypothetical protein
MNQTISGRPGRGIVVLLLVLAAMIAIFAPLQAEPNARYVDAATGSDSGVCTDAMAPCQTIGYAVGQSGTDDPIYVAGGTYVENIKLTDGIPRAIYGRYTNDGGTWTPGGETPTVIDGSDSDTVIEVRNHSDAVFEALTVTGGMGKEDPTFGNGCGGFKIQNSNVAIRHVAILDNSAGGFEGGALCAAGDDGQLTLLIDTSFVSGNRAGAHGGAFSLFNTKTTIVNSLITGNAADTGNGNVMVLYQDDDVTLLNSTVAGNNPTGAQAVLVWSGKMTVVNSIMWDNALNLQADPPCTDCIDVSYSDVQGWSGGTGNIDADPLFVDGAGGDYSLQAGSPAIDKGTAVGAPASDFDGSPRDAQPDMGAFEYIAPPLTYVYLPLVLAR